MNTIKLEVTEDQAAELEKLGYIVEITYLATIPTLPKQSRKIPSKSVPHCSPKALLELRTKPKNLDNADEKIYTAIAIEMNSRKKSDEKFPKARRDVMLSWIDKKFPKKARTSLSSNISRLIRAGALVVVE